MIKLKTLLAGAALGLLAFAGPVQAAEGQRNAADIDFSFEGPFGTYNPEQLQRGYAVYRNVCSACHSANLLYYRNLAEPGGPMFTEEQVKAIAAMDEVQDGPNQDGDMFTRPAKPSDHFKAPFPNEEAARAANGGALPPDLSLITKSREGWSYPWYVSPFIKMWKGGGGPEYVHALLTGFGETPDEAAGPAPEGKYYNPYFAHGVWIGMPPPLTEDGVDYADGTKATVDQQARDVAAFLAWAAEPKMQARKSMGFMVLLYMAVLTVLLYLTKKAVWSRVEH